MSARGRVTVIDLDHERLSFVAGDVGARRVRVETSGSVARPAGIDAAKAQTLGAWVGECLKNAGVAGRGGVLVCVPRGNVVMKRLAFPGLASHNDPDLVAMVRLQMTRQMPMKVEGTAIDFVPMGRVGAGGGGDGAGADGLGVAGAAGGAGEGPALEVLACALPGDRVEWCRSVAQAAGVKLGALSLRASGAATLLAQEGASATGTVLGISISWSSVEFVVVRDGEIVFVRSADVALTPDVDASSESRAEVIQYAERVAVEAKRTWMAYRVSPGSSEVWSVVVVGGGPLAREVADRCGRSLDLSASAAELPGFVEMVPASTDAASVALAPLVGLMVAHASDRPVFDFAHPRQAPDTGAGARRAALLGVLGAIVVIGGGLVLANMQVGATRTAAKQAERERNQWGERLVDHIRADARLQHAEQWLTADVDWIAHWAKISQTMPAPPEALLDSLGGSLTRYQVRFQPGASGSSKTYANSRWNLDLEAVLHATGRLSNRIVGNQFRERLVSDPTYVVESRGADTETSFDMDLVTSTRLPELGGATGSGPGPGPGALGSADGAGQTAAPDGASGEPTVAVATSEAEQAAAQAAEAERRQTASNVTHGRGGAP